MRTAAEYKKQLASLLPPGRLWDALQTDGTMADKLLSALAEEFARVDFRASDLMAEIDPRRALELLPEWEAWAGLPEVCTGSLATIEQRRSALRQKLTSVGGQSRAYFVGLAKAIGYFVIIDEFPVFTCESPCNQPIHGEEWRFVWRVNAPEVTIIDFTCESPCNEPLRSWGNSLLECTIMEFAPAHTNVLFGYNMPTDIDKLVGPLEYLANTALEPL